MTCLMKRPLRPCDGLEALGIYNRNDCARRDVRRRITKAAREVINR